MKTQNLPILYLFSFILLTLLASCVGVTPLANLTPTQPPTSVPIKTISPSLTPAPTVALQATPAKAPVWKEGQVYGDAISPDRTTIAIRTVDGITLYDSTTLEVIDFYEIETPSEYFRLPNNPALPIAFSPDGKYLAYSINYKVVVFNLSTGKDEKVLYSAIPTYHISGITISPDNKYYIVHTRGWYPPCDAAGGNLAIYEDHHLYKSGLLIFDSYFCEFPVLLNYRFTETNKAYFFYWHQTVPLPYRMDVINLSENSFDNVWYEYPNYDPEKVFYDVSPDGKTLASMEFQEQKYITRLIDVETGNVIEKIDGLIHYNHQTDKPLWEENWLEPVYSTPCETLGNGFFQYDDLLYKEVYSAGNSSTFLTLTHIWGRITAIELWDTASCEKKKIVSFN